MGGPRLWYSAWTGMRKTYRPWMPSRADVDGKAPLELCAVRVALTESAPFQDSAVIPANTQEAVAEISGSRTR